MKECPVCRRCFPDHVNHCPDDGDATTQSIMGEPVLDGRYQLEKRIGHGGMGVVFQARHIFLKTAHAIKIILPDLVGNDPMLVTRFRQEALAAAAIRHQNIIAVTDFGVVRTTMPFLVMEFVNGQSLHDMLGKEGALSPMSALEIISAIGAGVAAAHRQGIVHRDLKPLNIMFQEGLPVAEAVKVLDFGLAKIKSGELLGSFVQAKTSGLMGSPFYMAPEQWGDEEPDARADIYSLGVILFQMLGGDVPFKGTSIPSIMKKHLTTAPPTFASLGVQVPPQIEAVVRHALEKEAENRPASVEDFINELRDAVNSISASLSRTSLGHVSQQAQTISMTQGVTSIPPDATQLRIHTNPPGSRVYINNVSMGLSDEAGLLIVPDMLRGQHRIHIMHDGYAGWEKQVECSGGVCEVEATLQDLNETSIPPASVYGHQSFGDPYAGTISSGSLSGVPQQSQAAMEAQRLRQQAEALEEQDRREQEERERLALEEQAREEERRKAEQEAARLRAEEAERERVAAEERRLAAEEAARLKAAEEEARRQADEEAAAARQRAKEEEERKQAEEAARLKAEEERQRAEEEARQQAEAEARRQAEEMARLKAEEEARLKEEARLVAEAEAARKAAAEAARLRAEEEERQQRAREEEERRQAEEAARLKAEAEAKERAEAEAARQRAEEEARKLEDERRERERVAAEEREARQQREREEQAARIAATINPQPLPPSELDDTQGQRQGIITQQLGRDSLPGDSQPANAWQGKQPSQQGRPALGQPALGGPMPAVADGQRKSGVSTMMIAAIAGVLLIGGGFGVWYMTRSTTNTIADKSPTPLPTATATASATATPGQTPSTPPPFKPELIAIPGGRFQMGRDAEDNGTVPQVPAHFVDVKPFEIDKTEVTNAEYAEFVRATKHHPPDNWTNGQPVAGSEMLPVVNVSYEDAVEFARWRSKRDGKNYRLPTEEEWEYAARGGDQGNLYPWGNTWVEGYAGVMDPRVVVPKPVGSYPQDKTRWGVFDMEGNVYEWTSSKASYYPGNPQQVRPDNKNWIVRRGASFSTDSELKLPLTSRNWNDPKLKNNMLGFRLVRVGSSSNASAPLPSMNRLVNKTY